MTRKILLTILNVLPLAIFIIFFRHGGNVAIYMLPVWIAITILNFILTKTSKELICYNGVLGLFSAVGILIDGMLYFKYVCSDSVGKSVMIFEIIVVLIYITIITGIEYCFKKVKNQKENDNGII